MTRRNLDKETLQDLSERYSDDAWWQYQIFFHNSAGDFIFKKELDKIKELDFNQVVYLKEKILRIAEKTESEETLEQLAQIHLWENFLKCNEQLSSNKNNSENTKKEGLKHFCKEICLQIAKNHNCNEKTLFIIADKYIDVHQVDRELLESILFNPKTSGFTIAYITTLALHFPNLAFAIKHKSSDIFKIIRNHFENV